MLAERTMSFSSISDHLEKIKAAIFATLDRIIEEIKQNGLN